MPAVGQGALQNGGACMGFTEMNFMQFHRIAHAHSMSQSDYRFSLSSYGFGCYGMGTHYGGVFEIGFVEENPLVFDLMDQKARVIVNEGDVYIIPPNHRVEVSTLNGGAHRHSSAEFLIDCTTRCIPGERLDEADCARIAGQTIILPYVLPASPENEELIALIRQLARDRMFMNEKNYFEECQAFMQILSIVAQAMLRSVIGEPVSPAHRRYCQKAKEYVSQHIDRRISLEEIAGYVGINRNYLTNVFSACEHTRLSEYVNRVKLNHMMELIVKYGYTVRRASEAVGFTDVNYVSRIFKKYHGITLSEYRRILGK